MTRRWTATQPYNRPPRTHGVEGNGRPGHQPPLDGGLAACAERRRRRLDLHPDAARADADGEPPATPNCPRTRPPTASGCALHRDNETNTRGMPRRPQVRPSVSMNGLDGWPRACSTSLILLAWSARHRRAELLRHLKDDDDLSSIRGGGVGRRHRRVRGRATAGQRTTLPSRQPQLPDHPDELLTTWTPISADHAKVSRYYQSPA